MIIADNAQDRIRRVGFDGIITTIAGSSSDGFDGDGGLGIQARLSDPWSLAVLADNSVVIAEYGNARIRQLAADGIITTLAGNGSQVFNGDGIPPTQASIGRPTGIAAASDGSLLFAPQTNSGSGINRIRKIAPPLPGFTATDLAIASEDGRLLYRFTAEGRHLSTVDTLTKAVLYSFGYDSAGRLTSITDADNNITTIERDGSGNPTAIIAPFGQRTTLTVNGDGYLASVANPAGETHQLTYTADGLLTT